MSVTIETSNRASCTKTPILRKAPKRVETMSTLNSSRVSTRDLSTRQSPSRSRRRESLSSADQPGQMPSRHEPARTTRSPQPSDAPPRRRRGVSVQASGAFGGPRGASGERLGVELGIDSSSGSRALPPIREGRASCVDAEWATAPLGGAKVHLVGGASKPRFNLRGVVVEPWRRSAARTRGGTATRTAITRSTTTRT
jgi:hypothetical protein